MHFETALNVVWCALGALALGGAVRSAVHARRQGTHMRAAVQLFGVGLIVAALLFPYFSATDDILRIEHFSAQQSPAHDADRNHTSKRSGTSELIRLYETMDTPLVSSVAVLVVTFFFVLLVVTRLVAFAGHYSTQTGGRSPPIAA